MTAAEPSPKPGKPRMSPRLRDLSRTAGPNRSRESSGADSGRGGDFTAGAAQGRNDKERAMNLEFASMAENIADCTARIAASKALAKELADCTRMAQFEITRGCETIKPHTEPNAAKWPLRIATDNERANGRLAWVPGL